MSEESELYLVMTVAVAALVLGIIGNASARNRFMAECLKDRKEYECTAMWRAGDSHVIAVPVVISR